MSAFAVLVLGVALAALGGELFVRSAAALSAGARIPPAIVGATIVAFATSAPEVSVAIHAALDGQPQIGLGDSLGSNVVNLAVLLGMALLIAPMRPDRGATRRDAALAVLAPALIGVLALDGELSRVDALALLGVFAAWLSATVAGARAAHLAEPPAAQILRPAAMLAAGAGGLALLVAAGDRVVAGAVGLAAAWNLDGFAVGATVVAIGTSTPELATLVVGRLRGQHEIALGGILGSCVFNALFIAPAAALIQPITVHAALAVPLLFGAALPLVLMTAHEEHLGRGRGLLLLCTGAGYLWLAAD